MEIGAKRAELVGFLNSPAVNVNAQRACFFKQKQLLTNMVQYYLRKP
jgi:hypothetical protein